MPSRVVRETLAQDVGKWLTDGLIRSDQVEVLRVRWDPPSFGAAQIVKYFAYSGGLLAMAGLLGFVGAMSGSEGLAALELLLTGTGIFYVGTRLARDPLGRQDMSSRVLLALGFFAASLGVGVFADTLSLSQRQIALVTGLVCVPLGFAAAYRLRNTFVLTLSLLALFHWAGSWTGMVGRSTYEVAIEDPRAMAAIAAVAATFGSVHDRVLPRARSTFPTAWVAVALTYLNLSLLILTIDSRNDDALAWIVAWGLAGVGQLVVGARLHRTLFTAFGVTALSVNLFTRYCEHFWNSLDAGLFFLIAGAAAFVAGLACERVLRRGGLA